jgi:hypothetical protein
VFSTPARTYRNLPKPPKSCRVWVVTAAFHQGRGPSARTFTRQGTLRVLAEYRGACSREVRRPCYLCPRPGVETLMSMQEHPLDAGRKAGRAVAADRRRRGVPEGSAGLPPEKMRAVLAENGVTAGQSVAFLRGFWQGATTG